MNYQATQLFTTDLDLSFSENVGTALVTYLPKVTRRLNDQQWRNQGVGRVGAPHRGNYSRGEILAI